LEIIHVPGHSPGHVVFYSQKEGILIGGDVLFYGSIGRTDLPGGNHETLISGIKEKLFRLPDETKVYCGHGPETTLGFEKESNPFLT
jgi:glyoxylase-like metal-dependent hydrolase (beta-lactamase superfamily II)